MRNVKAYIVDPGLQSYEFYLITDCKKLVGYRNVYRIRVGDYRAFFTFHVEIIDDTVIFRYLVLRGEAYSKKTKTELGRIDD